jgi:membrane protein DedA with SNARE-associated domain
MDGLLGDGVTAPALFGVCLATGILIPVPEDVPVLAAGIAAQSGILDVGTALAAATAGVFLRDCLFFGAGRLLGEQVLVRPTVVRLLGESRIERARHHIGGRGPQAVLIGRFLIGFRTPVFLTAGALGVPPSSFAMWDLLGLLIMVPLMFSLGYFLGQPALDFLQWGVDQTGWVIPVVLAAGVALGLVLRRVHLPGGRPRGG